MLFFCPHVRHIRHRKLQGEGVWNPKGACFSGINFNFAPPTLENRGGMQFKHGKRIKINTQKTIIRVHRRPVGTIGLKFEKLVNW